MTDLEITAIVEAILEAGGFADRDVADKAIENIKLAFPAHAAAFDAAVAANDEALGL